MNKNIGGFIPWENWQLNCTPYHESATNLSSARSALSYIIHNFKVKKIYTPSYICPEIVNLLNENVSDVITYDIDDLFFPKLLPTLNKSEFFLYVNYFGICRSNVLELKNIYNDKLIIDLSMAFFEKNYNLLSFNSCRKFFGTPDGAYMFGTNISSELEYNPLLSTRHLHLSNLNQDLAYKLFRVNENCISSKIYNMSLITQSVMKSIDYSMVMQTRIKNFNYLNDVLNISNLLKINNLFDEVPLYYPYLPNFTIDRNVFHKSKIYTPKLWDNLKIYNNKSFSLFLVNKLIPLPIDQRYNNSDMDFILNIVKEKYT